MSQMTLRMGEGGTIVRFAGTTVVDLLEAGFIMWTLVVNVLVG